MESGPGRRHGSRSPRGRGRPGGGRGAGGGRRPRLTQDEIVQAALEIAEEEGVKSVSMRKVARRLGAGTMSLYHYVQTKDDLLVLMDDAIMGELVIPEGEMPEGWRERLTLIAKLSLAAWLKRPWVADLDEDFRITENGLRHMDQSMGALEGLDIDPALKFEILTQVDDYLFGFAVRERKVEHNGIQDPEVSDEVIEFVETRVATGSYPYLERAFAGHRSFDEQWRAILEGVFDAERFDRGLKRLLDGIEAELIETGALPR